MGLLEAMQERRSVRQFTSQAISGETRAALEGIIKQVNDESGLNIQLVTRQPAAFKSILAGYGRFKNVANYLALVGPDIPDLDELCGYFGEKIVLEAQALGLGTCWVGGTYSKKKTVCEVNPGERLSLVIAIGYPAQTGAPHKSRAISDVSSVEAAETPEWFTRGIEAALLAPTAMNQQRFMFTLAQDGTVRAKAGGMAFGKVDLGIAEYHFELASGVSVSGSAIERLRERR